MLSKQSIREMEGERMPCLWWEPEPNLRRREKRTFIITIAAAAAHREIAF